MTNKPDSTDILSLSSSGMIPVTADEKPQNQGAESEVIIPPALTPSGAMWLLYQEQQQQ